MESCLDTLKGLLGWALVQPFFGVALFLPRDPVEGVPLESRELMDAAARSIVVAYPSWPATSLIVS